MTIDLSGPLRKEFDKAKEDHDKARAEGNSHLASEKAGKCAKLLRLLADNIPYDRKLYLGKAIEWDNLAQALREGRLMEPRGGQEQEFKDYIEGLISTSSTTWQDIGGLDEAKRLLQETVVIAAVKKPEAIKPWQGILMYGPPGTGKTLLAAAAAGSLKAPFFNVAADKVLSKYFGESSRLIAALYEVAMQKSPAIVFIDELDALTLSRSGEISDASTRALSTLLTQLDGFKGKKSDRLVLTLAATNAPQHIDTAALSRFPRRIYISLPDRQSAADIIKLNTSGLDISHVNVQAIASKAEQRFFSGREIANLCQEAIWHMLRQENPNLAGLSKLSFEELQEKCLRIRNLSDSDFSEALGKIKSPVPPEKLAEYSKWAEEFGD